MSGCAETSVSTQGLKFRIKIFSPLSLATPIKFFAKQTSCIRYKNDFVSDTACLFCEELYSQSYSNEPWICCQKCNSWCHCLCAGVDKKGKKFICELCL